METIKLNIAFFKSSGKWYHTDEIVETNIEDTVEGMYQLMENVRTLITDFEIGVVNPLQFNIVVTPIEPCNNAFPFMVPIKN